MDKTKIITIGIFILLFLLAFNLIILDVKLFLTKEPEEKTETVTESSVTPTPSAIINEETMNCSPACLQAIETATASIKLPTAEKEIQNKAVATKEIFVPLGSGSTKNTSWVNIGGIETYIDTSKYTKIKEANFEAALRIPTANGKAYARLYNVNDDHPVWNSEVWVEGQAGNMVRSEKISFASGNRLYRVQLYSSLGYEVFLDNARIRIVYE